MAAGIGRLQDLSADRELDYGSVPGGATNVPSRTASRVTRFREGQSNRTVGHEKWGVVGLIEPPFILLEALFRFQTFGAFGQLPSASESYR
jgi:hypothetical protein